MSMLIYATDADLLDGWLTVLPDDAAALLRRASLLVDEAVRMDCYDTDAADAPTDPRVAAAFRDATCQQVVEWVAAGLDPDAGAVGQAPQVVSQSTEGDSVTYAPRPTPAEIAAATDYLCRASLLILRAAGLGSRVPRVL
ncbi:Uncharacterised protein [Mycobacteroides abscessus subsp. abscessus]|nr:Uncharacterised protein [Mycobacteroides abscessus subsp. abscessus]